MPTKQQYQCEMQSVAEFVSRVQRLVSRGYYFCFVGSVPHPKDPAKLDIRMIQEWNLDRPNWQWAARHRRGESSVHYVRFRRRFVLLSTHGWSGQSRQGRHRQTGRFFREHPGFQDLKDEGLKVSAYNIKSTWSRALNRRTTLVSLNRRAYRVVKAGLLRKATSPRYHSRDSLEQLIENLPLCWYGPVRQQIRGVVNAVNRVRRRSGLPQIRVTRCIPRTRI